MAAIFVNVCLLFVFIIADNSKFSAKVTSRKYRVTKGGSPGYRILALGKPPVGFIQIGKSI